MPAVPYPTNSFQLSFKVHTRNTFVFQQSVSVVTSCAKDYTVCFNINSALTCTTGSEPAEILGETERGWWGGGVLTSSNYGNGGVGALHYNGVFLSHCYDSFRYYRYEGNSACIMYNIKKFWRVLWSDSKFNFFRDSSAWLVLGITISGWHVGFREHLCHCSRQFVGGWWGGENKQELGMHGPGDLIMHPFPLPFLTSDI
jgi:hypothetical protein